MEHSLLWSTIGIACLGAVWAWLARRRAGAAEGISHVVSPRLLALAVALPPCVFLATLPARHPWSAGQGLGRGFLLGGLGALGAAWICVRPQRAAGDDGSAAVAGPQFLALAGVAALLLGMHAVIEDALCGLAIGWTAVTIVLLAGLRDSERGAAAHLVASCGFAVTLCAAALAGVYRDALSATTVRGPWAALVATTGAAVPLLTILAVAPAAAIARAARRVPGAGWIGNRLSRLGASKRSEDAAARVAQVVIGSGVLLLAVWLLGSRLLGEGRPVFAAAAGLASGFLAWWLVADARSQADETPAAQPSVPPLAAFVVLAAFMIAGQYMQGVGAAVTALAAWLVVGAALPGRGDTPSRDGAGDGVPAAGLVGVLTFGTLLVLFRVFGSRYVADLRGVALTDTYALFGFLSGALLPGLVSGLLVAPSTDPDTGRQPGVGRVLLAGALLLAVPGAIVLLWGPKCVLALAAGVALAAALPAWPRSSSGHAAHLPVACALAASLAALQWTGRVLPLSELTRAEKIHIVAWTAAGILALALAVDCGGRLTHRRRPATASGMPPQEGPQ